MMKKSLLWLACTCALFASDAELEQLKKQMAQLQQQLSEMQKHIQILESGSSVSLSDTDSDEEMLEKMASKNEKPSLTTLLPDIALILNGGYTSRNVTNAQYANASIPGFVNAGNMELPFNAKNGFNLNYAEVAMSSTVDPYLDANVIFHIHGNGTMEVEEAFFSTRALDYGLRAKVGKFKSAFVRVN